MTTALYQARQQEELLPISIGDSELTAPPRPGPHLLTPYAMVQSPS